MQVAGLQTPVLQVNADFVTITLILPSGAGKTSGERWRKVRRASNRQLNWHNIATFMIMADNTVLERAANLMKYGVGKYEALHVASSIIRGAGLFVTTDDRLQKRLRSANSVVAMLPQDALAFLEKWYEN